MTSVVTTTPSRVYMTALHLAPVPRVHDLDSLRLAVKENRPCIWSIPTAMQLPFQQKWTQTHLREALSDQPLQARWTPSRRYVDPGDSLAHMIRSLVTFPIPGGTFADRCDELGLILSGTDTYLFHHGAPSPRWSSLSDDVFPAIHERYPSLLSRDRLDVVGLWVSGRGVRSMTHFDDSTAHNLNFQVCGRKRFRLWPPDQWRQLSTFLAMSLHRFADLDRPSHELSQHGFEVELQAGDLLFIPSYWYHQVDHLGEFNLNMTCWFRRARQTVLRAPGWSCRDPRAIMRLMVAGTCAYVLGPWLRRSHIKRLPSPR